MLFNFRFLFFCCSFSLLLFLLVKISKKRFSKVPFSFRSSLYRVASHFEKKKWGKKEVLILQSITKSLTELIFFCLLLIYYLNHLSEHFDVLFYLKNFISFSNIFYFFIFLRAFFVNIVYCKS